MRFLKFLSVSALALSVLSGCSTLQGYGIDKQKIGTGIGAVVGIGVGSLVGGGMGKKVAMVIGGVAGGYIGNQIGASLDEQDKKSLEQKTVAMLNSQSPDSTVSTSWMSPQSKATADIVASPVHVKKTTATVKSIPAVHKANDLVPINAEYIAKSSANIRLSPSASGQKISSLPKDTKFVAVGETKNGWVLVSRKNTVVGYVKGDLVKRFDAAQSVAKVRDIDDQKMLVEKAAVNQIAPKNTDLNKPVVIDLDAINPEVVTIGASVSCRNLQYKIKDGGGNPSESSVEACKNEQGDWVVL